MSHGSSVNVQHGHGCSARLCISEGSKLRLFEARPLLTVLCSSAEVLRLYCLCLHSVLIKRWPSTEGLQCFRALIYLSSEEHLTSDIPACKGPKYPIFESHAASAVLDV